MTTEQQYFIDQITYLALEQQSHSIQNMAEGFFIANVCIPKGLNRHKFANELHAWVEGTEIEFTDSAGIWFTERSPSFYWKYKLRIKPSEPQYEWQWYFIQRDGTAFVEQKFYADGELPTDYKWYKLEETKRARQSNQQKHL